MLRNSTHLKLDTLHNRHLHIYQSNPALVLDGPANSTAFVLFYENGEEDWALSRNAAFNNDLQFISLAGTDLQVMTLQQDGNVGIGTTSPAGKLDVNGTIYQRGSSLHADYVFENDYELESIREHADFMWKNKHLKGIPKAKVDENGMEIVEVGSHRKGIVEELEKAHIYIEQLEGELRQQKKKFDERLVKLEALLNEK